MEMETIDDYLFQLKKQMEQARERGHRGKMMAHRIEDDLKRLMNSGWLNLAEYIADCNDKKAGV